MVIGNFLKSFGQAFPKACVRAVPTMLLIKNKKQLKLINGRPRINCFLQQTKLFIF